jgi:hypothetical protein
MIFQILNNIRLGNGLAKSLKTTYKTLLKLKYVYLGFISHLISMIIFRPINF